MFCLNVLGEHIAAMRMQSWPACVVASAWAPARFRFSLQVIRF